MLKPVNYQKHFVIGTPLVAWKCEAGEHMSWLEDSRNIIKKFPNVRWFAAFELDSRGLGPFSEVINALRDLNGDFWTYSINDMESKVNHTNRWIRIEMGRNLIREFAQRNRITTGHHWGEDCTEQNLGVVNYEAILYVDSDIVLTHDVVEKLLEVDRPLVGADIDAYCLSGKEISSDPPIQEHWNSAGCLLVNSPAFYDLPWLHNAWLNLSDDPSFQSLAERLLRREGVENLDTTYGMTWVRKDAKVRHRGRMLEVEHRNIPDREI